MILDHASIDDVLQPPAPPLPWSQHVAALTTNGDR